MGGRGKESGSQYGAVKAKQQREIEGDERNKEEEDGRRVTCYLLPRRFTRLRHVMSIHGPDSVNS